jgi:hypothetical protein
MTIDTVAGAECITVHGHRVANYCDVILVLISQWRYGQSISMMRSPRVSYTQRCTSFVPCHLRIFEVNCRASP